MNSLFSTDFLLLPSILRLKILPGEMKKDIKKRRFLQKMTRKHKNMTEILRKPKKYVY